MEEAIAQFAVGLSLVNAVYLDHVWRRQRRFKEGLRTNVSKGDL